MFNVEYYFIVNGYWEWVKEDILDYRPEEGEAIYYEGKRCYIVDVSEDDSSLKLFLE